MASSQVGAPSVPAPAQSTPFERRTMGYPIVSSTEEQSPPREPLKQLFVPIISIDHLSQDYKDLPVDNILALGDQALLHKLAPDATSLEQLEEAVDEPDVFGPLVTELYGKLNSLKTCGPCEVLLYLSGHGIDPGNICLVPDAMKPHPTRSGHDLGELDPQEWYKYNDRSMQEANQAESYLEDFYHNYAKAITKHNGPLGFVGGEVYAHHRGFIGVLGVLGLWCYAHCECEGDTYHHLVIVADCCFAGIWGATLERIMKCTEPCFEGYRKLLHKYPVSIQCATNEFEASHGGLFTPLWYFLQPATEQQLRNYRPAFNESEPVSEDEMETQHPCYVSTSKWRPTWKCFDDPKCFVDLHAAQLQQLKNYVLPAEVCQDNCPPLVWPFIIALKREAEVLCEKLKDKLRAVNILEKASEEVRASHEPQVAHSIYTIKQSYARLRDLLFNAIPRSQRPLRHFVLDQPGNKLSKATLEQLKKTLQSRDQERAIDPGVYVFQGGEGDMSLIVTPGQEQVILIDGTKTAACFKAAWDSILKYLKRITMIFVTHHDEDHTFGIQLLLARYCVEPTDMLPALRRTTIYMNTRAALRRKNFRHEQEIETLANHLDLRIKPLIITDAPLAYRSGEFCLCAILPKKALVDEVQRAYDRDHQTRSVSSRGGTTAANVLSINVVAVWKKRDAYLFTGDAHLADVTEAAQDFLGRHGMITFKYVDVPHHGSRKSNVDDVNQEDRGLARIPAEHYLISHCGNRHNPSLTTVTHILKRDQCQKLYFLYPSRNVPVSCLSCQECDNDIHTSEWHCECVREFQHKIETVPLDGCFKFFKFD